jgi:hypothetical protein
MKIIYWCHFSHEGMVCASCKFHIPEVTYSAVNRTEVTECGDLFICLKVIIIL